MKYVIAGVWIKAIIQINCVSGWLKSVDSWIVYELDYREPVLHVIPFPSQSILGKLPVVPVGDAGTLPYHLRYVFSGVISDRRPGAGDRCWMCGLSIRGHRHCPGISVCNKRGEVTARDAIWSKAPCDYVWSKKNLKKYKKNLKLDNNKKIFSKWTAIMFLKFK